MFKFYAMIYWGQEYFNTSLEEYKVIYPDVTSDYIKKDTLSVFRSFFRNSRPKVFVKKVYLEISQNSQENISVSVTFLIKLQS